MASYNNDDIGKILNYQKIISEKIDALCEGINKMQYEMDLTREEYQNSIHKVLYSHEGIRAQYDNSLDTTCRNKTVQTTRGGGNEVKKKTEKPRKNILAFIKEGYIEHNWKFFDPFIVDAETIIKEILEKKHSELIKRKDGVARRNAEAAAIWGIIKQVDGVLDEMRSMFECHKEDIEKKQMKLIENDNSSNSDIDN